MTGSNAVTRLIVASRNGGRCLRCNSADGQHVHHRKPRGMGGTKDPAINAPVNLVWICLDCHTWIESHRTDSYREGWLVNRNGKPAEQYLIDQHSRMIMLTVDGGMEVHQLPTDYEEVPF